MKNTEKLIIKYLNNSISEKEWDELNLWFEHSKNTKTCDEYIKINYAIEYIMSEFNTEKTKNHVLKKIKKDKHSIITLQIRKHLKYVAVIIMLVGIGYMYQQGFFLSNLRDMTFPKEDKVTLELENGNLEILYEEETTDIINTEGKVIGTQKGNQLIYKTSQTEPKKLAYNQLTVPYGKRFELKLSDGTIAHLNSGSSLKYPVSFLKKGVREVFLVGEAFLNVVKDTERPFIVNTSDNLDIRVLGTQFNVSNYPEDKTTEVVLVEGSVDLQIDGKSTVVIEPSFKGSFDRQKKNISTKHVIPSIYTLWIKGELAFREISLDNILKKLERHYNVVITNKNVEYSKKKFNANFGDEPIETVLSYFKNIYGINYTINSDRIILE